MLVTIFYHIDEFCKVFEKQLGNRSLACTEKMSARGQS